MVGSSHEASHRIFQERPDVLRPVFRILDLPLPRQATVDVLTPDATEIRPLERRVDTVLKISPADSEHFLLAIEAQGKQDPDKPVSWAYYVSYLKAKYRCPALLLVTCQDEATADWANRAIPLGVRGSWNSLYLHPLVLGPGNVPRITDPYEAARDLTLTAFSAMTHGRDPKISDILEVLARALADAAPESAAYYAELLEIGLGDTPARETWRKLMHTGSYFPGRGTVVEESFLKGEAEGEARGRLKERAEIVLEILEGRKIPVSAAVRERVLGCIDHDELGRWLRRAVSATDAEEIFRSDGA